MAPPTADTLILGCGYLGRRVAARWRAAGRTVAALTRRNADRLVTLGIEPIVGDVLDPTSLLKLPPARTILLAIGRDRTSGKTIREVQVHGLRNVLDTIPPPHRFIHVSSTSVYGQGDGSWVDEEAPTEPAEEAGKVALEAERLLRSRLPGAIVLRFAGIYGPDRLLRKEAILGGEPLVGDAGRWLNLIHVDDGAEAILAAEARGIAGATYNIADGEPVTRCDFYVRLAAILNAPAARFETGPEAAAANRRISNRRAREQLGWTPRYSSYRDGLDAAMDPSSG